MVFNLSDHNSVANNFILELRDINVQRDRMRFRRNLERLGEVLAYEISKTLSYANSTVQTPLATCHAKKLSSAPVLLAVLRAGLPMLQGFLNFFDSADAGFIGAARNENAHEVTIRMDYLATGAIEGRDIIIIDPMLATGSSIEKTLGYILSQGTPSSINIAVAIASPEGLHRIQNFFRSNNIKSGNLWIGALDDKLNDQFYIVPGLGDAGDLSFGAKN
jgi:uracil phosphoribosyltransferase